MRRTVRIFLSSLMVVVIFGLSAHTPAWGQSGSTTASVTGIVTDEQGAIIPGAVVTAKNLQTNLMRETQSGEDGSFLISQLPPGTYELMVTVEGFTTKTSRLDLVLGTTTLFNFPMSVGANTEVVEVKAGATIDEGKTESSTNNDRGRIDGLPINMRNFLDFSLTSPRVTLDRTPLQGITVTSGLSFNGQSARFNNITIDGVDNNDNATGAVRATFSQDAVQEFQVVSDSYSAEFGRALGGVVNIVTRAGSNEFHGNLFVLDRNDSISARNPFSPINPEFKQYQFGATLGGPIKRDRAFFFASFERLSLKQNNIVTIADETVVSARRQGFVLSNGPQPFSIGTTSVLYRADARLASNDTLWVRYNFGGTYNGTVEPFSGLTAETSAGVQRVDENAIAVDNTYVSTGLNLVNETRFLFSRRTQDLLPLDGGPQVRLLAPEGLVTFGRSIFLPQPGRLVKTYQFVDNVSLVRGRHQIKTGVDFEYLDFKSPLLLIGGGLATFTPIDFAAAFGNPAFPSFTGLQAFDPTLRTPEQRAFLLELASQLPDLVPGFPRNLPLDSMALPVAYLQGFGDPTSRITGKFFSLFLQDDIKLKPNLLIKAGVRYDLNRLDAMPDNGGNLSPRLAVSYRPARLPKMQVRATYGLFFGLPVSGIPFAVKGFLAGIKVLVIPFPFSVLPFALPGHRFPETDQLPPGVTFIPQLSLNGLIQPDARNSYTQQASFGFDYFILGNTLVSATYDFVRGIKLGGLRNINPIVRPIAGNPVLSAITGRVDPTRGDEFEFEFSRDSYYHALTLSINRRFTNHFGFLASYTFSKAIDDSVDNIRFELGTANDPLRPGLERGLSLQDVRSRFVASGMWDLSYTKNRYLTGFQLSTIINVSSGRPYNLLAGVDLNMNGDSPPADRPLGLGRNVGITPGFASVDLRLTRTVAVKERCRLQGFVEAFNLFNRVNISEVDGTFPPDAQGNFHLPPKEGSRYIAPPDRYRNAFAPRQFQIGFRLTF